MFKQKQLISKGMAFLLAMTLTVGACFHVPLAADTVPAAGGTAPTADTSMKEDKPDSSQTDAQQQDTQSVPQEKDGAEDSTGTYTLRSTVQQDRSPQEPTLDAPGTRNDTVTITGDSTTPINPKLTKMIIIRPECTLVQQAGFMRVGEPANLPTSII